MARWIIEVKADQWGGVYRPGWRPAVDGTVNQTFPHETADEASTFPNREEARRALRNLFKSDLANEGIPFRIRKLGGSDAL